MQSAIGDLPDASPSPSETPSDRRHDLDALRAIAMLLGIVLHGALSFSPIPWSVKDSQQSDLYYVLFAGIHGFRMPLFFMLSGFFTAMLWRKRGLGGLVKQRLKRILLPLCIGCLTIVPAMWAVSIFVSQPASTESENAEVWSAVFNGDVERVSLAVQNSEVEIDALYPASGASMLTSAVFLGHTDLAQMLIEAGADVNLRNRDQGTALHSAAFLGRGQEAALLIAAGADVDGVDGSGKTPADLLSTDFGTTSFIARTFGVQLDEQTLKSGRAEVAKHLNVNEYLGSPSSNQSAEAIAAIKALLFQLPVFMHLWFLAFLCWLVAAFVIYALLADRLGVRRLPKWLVCSPVCLLWLIPLTMGTQSIMQSGSFGPGVSIGLLPIPGVLAYYAVFFFFGAVYWDMDDNEGRLGRWWSVALPVALLIAFPVGLDLVSGTFGFVPQLDNASVKTSVASFMQAAFVWLMIIGSIGMFRRLLSGESKTMRYISDSSYWLYLAHLPLILLAQWFVRDWSLPAFIKFAGVTIVVSAFLLVTYEYGVRYTIIGRILNGPRTRPSKTAKR